MFCFAVFSTSKPHNKKTIAYCIVNETFFSQETRQVGETRSLFLSTNSFTPAITNFWRKLLLSTLQISIIKAIQRMFMSLQVTSQLVKTFQSEL